MWADTDAAGRGADVVVADAWVKIGAATSPSFSKNGERIFHLRGAGLPQVWVMDADGTNAAPLSFQDEKVGFLRRSPADDRLIWGIDAGGDERQQLFLREPAGQPRALTEAPRVIHDFGAWSADGARIAFAANDRDERFFDISVMELATGARTKLLESKAILTVPSWSPDGTRLLVIEDHSSTDTRLWILDVASAKATRVPAAALTRFASVRWTSDGAGLMGLTDHGGSDFMRLCRIDPASGETSAVYDAPARDVEAWALTPDGATLATVENDRGYGMLRVGAFGTERPVVTGLPEGIVGDLNWGPGGKRLAFTAQGPVTPPGIWLWQDGAVRPLVQPDPAEAGIDPARLVAPSLVEWTSFDGRTIPGWFAHAARVPRRWAASRRGVGAWRPGVADAGQFPARHPDAAVPGLRRADAEHPRQHRLWPRLYGSRRSRASAPTRWPTSPPAVHWLAAQPEASTPSASASWANPMAGGWCWPP